MCLRISLFVAKTRAVSNRIFGDTLPFYQDLLPASWRTEPVWFGGFVGV